MTLFNKKKSTRRVYRPVQCSPRSVAGHGIGVGITAITLLVIIAMVYKLQGGRLSA